MRRSILSVVSLLCTVNLVAQNQNELNFDGVDDYVNLNIIQDEFYANKDQFTIEFWLKGHKDNQTSSIRTTLFAINEPLGENRLLIIMGGTSAQDGKLMIYPDGSWGAGAIYTSSVIIGDGNCHHIAYTYDNGNCTVYIDGDLVNTHFADCPITIDDRYSLGQEYDNTSTSQFFNGSIDDLRIWSTVRTSSQIADNMNEELAGDEAGLMAYYDFNIGDPSGYNIGLNSLTDLAPNDFSGTLVNFGLTDTLSNWIRGMCVSSFVGINDMSVLESSGDLNLYPIPANDMIHFSSPSTSGLVYVQIYDLCGKMIFEKEFVVTALNEELSVDIRDLNSGTYYLKADTSEGQFFQTFVKNP